MRLTHLLSSSEGTSGVYNGHTPSTSSFDTSTPNSCPGLLLHSKTQSWQDYRSQSSECPQARTGQSLSVRSMSPRTWNSILHGPRKLGLPTLVVQVAKNQLPTQETQRRGFNPRVGPYMGVTCLELHHMYKYAAAAAKSLQSCPTLCDPIDGSPPGSPVPGILQARTLEWVAISFSNA